MTGHAIELTTALSSQVVLIHPRLATCYWPKTGLLCLLTLMHVLQLKWCARLYPVQQAVCCQSGQLANLSVANGARHATTQLIAQMTASISHGTSSSV